MDGPVTYNLPVLPPVTATVGDDYRRHTWGAGLSRHYAKLSEARLAAATRQGQFPL